MKLNIIKKGKTICQEFQHQITELNSKLILNSGNNYVFGKKNLFRFKNIFIGSQIEDQVSKIHHRSKKTMKITITRQDAKQQCIFSKPNHLQIDDGRPIRKKFIQVAAIDKYSEIERLKDRIQLIRMKTKVKNAQQQQTKGQNDSCFDFCLIHIHIQIYIILTSIILIWNIKNLGLLRKIQPDYFLMITFILIF